LFFPIGDIGVESDFYSDLVVAAQNLGRGDFTVADYPYKGPFYSFVLVVIHFLVRDWYLSGILMSGICAACGLFILYRLLLSVFSRFTAALTVVSVSLVSEFFVVAHKASSDMLFFLLCFVVMYLVIAESPSLIRLAAAGAISSLAFLTRYNGIFLPLSVAAVILLINPWKWAWRRKITSTAIYLTVFLLVCSPWFIKNHRETGSFLETRNHENIEREFYRGEREIRIPEGGFGSVYEIVAHDPAYFMGHYLLNIARIFWKDMAGTLGLPAGILVILGLIGCFMNPPGRQRWSFYIFSIAYLLVISLVFHLSRLSLPLTPAYYGLAFSFLAWLGGRIPEKKRKPAFTICSVVIAVLLGVKIWRIGRVEKGYYIERPLFALDTAEFLLQPSVRGDSKRQPVLMARKPHIAHYADMEFKFYPPASRDYYQFIGSILERDVDFAAYGVVEKAYDEGGLYGKWMDITPGFEKIYDEHGTVIYRIAEWLDLESSEGRAALASMRNEVKEAEEAGNRNRILNASYRLSRILMFNGEWEEAVIYSKKALSITRQSPELGRYSYLQQFNLSQSYLRIGKHEEGIAVLGKYTGSERPGINPGILANMHVLVSRHLVEMGRGDTAIGHLEKALELFEGLKDRTSVDYVEKEIGRLRLKETF
jgi:hypothetical protein